MTEKEKLRKEIQDWGQSHRDGNQSEPRKVNENPEQEKVQKEIEEWGKNNK